jgi:FdhD protein
MQLTVSQNFRAQTAASFQEIFRAGRECAIHPVTRRALLRSIKTNALNLKFLADEFVQIKAARDHVAPRRGRRSIMCIQRSAELFENVERKKSDLSLVVVLEVEVTISANPAACDTFDHGHFDRGMRVRLPTVMANEIVSRRNVQVTDFHRLQQYLKSSLMKEVPSIGPGRIIRRRRDGSLEYLRDDLTIEEPLEIRIAGKPLATTMRTPGHDEELAAGFLVSEAIVRDRGAIAGISRDGDNGVIVDLATGVKLKLNSAQRFGTISSSCGLCGKTSIDAIRQSFPAIESTNVRIDIETLLSLPEKLRKAQSDFTRTGGIHAAGIFDSSGELKTVREDIGRHNAVDKVIGRALLDGLLPLNRDVLLVSGRASFEIVQKALSAGIPIVAAVSAPSTLAAEFARESNQTLIGFLRPPSFNIYSHIERVILEER